MSANQAIREFAISDPSSDGMGAACVCVLIIGNRLYTAHLGNSRLYLLREEALHQLTFDHTWLKDNRCLGLNFPGGMTRAHPLAHVISR